MQPRSWPCVRAVMIIIRTNWVLWFSQTLRCDVSVPHGGGDTLTPAPRYPLLPAGRWIWQQILLDVDMWEDGTDHVLHPWCLHVWWDHRCGPAERWQTLFVPLLDILKVMYIKAELFWLGRCQHTFIWSERHDGFHLKNAALKVCNFKRAGIYKLFSVCTRKQILNQSRNDSTQTKPTLLWIERMWGFK